jgi:signal peptidase I
LREYSKHWSSQDDKPFVDIERKGRYLANCEITKSTNLVKFKVIMSQANSAQRLYPKEPWLAVNLSMFFPGFGQIYSKQLTKGLIIAIVYPALFFYTGWLLINPTGDIQLVIICLLLAFFVKLVNLFDTYNCAKKLNSKAFETLRKSQKDPWLAVFLSRIIPGLGHIYIGKIFIGCFLLGVSLIVPFLNIIILPFVAYNAYVSSSTRRERSNLPIALISFGASISIIISLIIPFSFKTFIAEARYIPSGAMLPTLGLDDRLVIDKLNYRFHDPQRGDIVVFSPTEILKQQNLKDAFIKRVIGLPGETIQVKDNEVYINGQVLLESYIKDAPGYEWGPVTVPPNSYAVLGDNRNNSYDSQYWGFVPRENIIGKANKIFWPLNRAGTLSDSSLFISSEKTFQQSTSISQVDSFQEAIETGMIAANLTQSAKTKKEWDLVAKQWQKAIELLKSVSNSSANYGKAQIKIEEYSKNLKYANQRLY